MAAFLECVEPNFKSLRHNNIRHIVWLLQGLLRDADLVYEVWARHARELPRRRQAGNVLYRAGRLAGLSRASSIARTSSPETGGDSNQPERDPGGGVQPEGGAVKAAAARGGGPAVGTIGGADGGVGAKKPLPVTAHQERQQGKQILWIIYHRKAVVSMLKIHTGLYDVQLQPPVDTCMRCGEGVNEYEAAPDEWGHVLCPACRALLEAIEHE